MNFPKSILVVGLVVGFMFNGCSSNSMANLNAKQIEAIQAIADNKFVDPYDGAPSWAQNPIQFAEKNGLGLVSVGMVSMDYISSSEALSRAKDDAIIELAKTIGLKAQNMVENYSSSQRARKDNSSFSNRTNVYRITTNKAMVGTQVLYTAFNNGHAFALVGMNISKIKSMMAELGTLIPEVERNNFSQAINSLSSQAFDRMDKQLSKERSDNNYRNSSNPHRSNNNLGGNNPQVNNYRTNGQSGFNNNATAYNAKNTPVNVGLRRASNGR